MAAQGRSSAHCGARRVLVPSLEVSPESPGHGPVRPRSLCDTPRRPRRLDREPRCRARPACADDAKDASVIRFFQSHRWLLSDPRFAKEAKLRLGSAKRSLAATQTRADAGSGRARPPQSCSGPPRGRAEGAARASPRCARRRRRSATSSAPTAAKRSRWRGASPATGRPRRTASTSGSSRWARTSARCSVTARARSTRRRPRTGTSSSRDATGARGRASPWS